jgi:hypothetical protein
MSCPLTVVLTYELAIEVFHTHTLHLLCRSCLHIVDGTVLYHSLDTLSHVNFFGRQKLKIPVCSGFQGSKYSACGLMWYWPYPDLKGGNGSQLV